MSTKSGATVLSSTPHHRARLVTVLVVALLTTAVLATAYSVSTSANTVPTTKTGLRTQPATTVNELVTYVDEKISEALVQTKSGSFQSAAVLAALNIAEELILLKKRIRKDLLRLEDRTQKVSRELDKIKGSKAGHA